MEWLILAAAAYFLTRPRPMNGGAEVTPDVQMDIMTGGEVSQGPRPAFIPTTTGFDTDVERAGPDRIGTPIGSGTPAGSITGPGLNLNIGGVLNFVGRVLGAISPILGPTAPIARTVSSVAIAIGTALPRPVPAVQPTPSVRGVLPVDRDPLEAGLRDIQSGLPGGERYDLEFSRGGFVFEADPATGAGGTGLVETVRGIREFELPAIDWGAPTGPEESEGYFGGGEQAV